MSAQSGKYDLSPEEQLRNRSSRAENYLQSQLGLAHDSLSRAMSETVQARRQARNRVREQLREKLGRKILHYAIRALPPGGNLFKGENWTIFRTDWRKIAEERGRKEAQLAEAWEKFKIDLLADRLDQHGVIPNRCTTPIENWLKKDGYSEDVFGFLSTLSPALNLTEVITLKSVWLKLATKGVHLSEVEVFLRQYCHDLSVSDEQFMSQLIGDLHQANRKEIEREEKMAEGQWSKFTKQVPRPITRLADVDTFNSFVLRPGYAEKVLTCLTELKQPLSLEELIKLSRVWVELINTRTHEPILGGTASTMADRVINFLREYQNLPQNRIYPGSRRHGIFLAGLSEVWRAIVRCGYREADLEPFFSGIDSVFQDVSSRGSSVRQQHLVQKRLKPQQRSDLEKQWHEAQHTISILRSRQRSGHTAKYLDVLPRHVSALATLVQYEHFAGKVLAFLTNLTPP